MKTATIHSTKLNEYDEQLLNGLDALSDRSRYKMFKLLLDDRREYCVSEIAHQLGISTSAVSQHFRIFELSGMVSKTRYGQKICYALKSDDPLIDILSHVVKHNNKEK